jgi:hypothetical protein
VQVPVVELVLVVELALVQVLVQAKVQMGLVQELVQVRVVELVLVRRKQQRLRLPK